LDNRIEKTVRYYDKLAPKYDRQYKSYLEHTHGKLLSRISLSVEDRILDSSAGTGLLAESLLDQYGSFQKLVLNDPSHKMLEKAKSRLNGHPDIEYHHKEAEELDFETESFDQVICLNAFHYYSDQHRVLNHFERILKPGGTLWIQDWNRTGAFVIANKLIGWLSPENINTRTREELFDMLEMRGFSIESEDAWGYRWWNFCFLKAVRG
jgi:ubiquinone/menaquinone biosynthesis C-methylase UbiE